MSGSARQGAPAGGDSKRFAAAHRRSLRAVDRMRGYRERVDKGIPDVQRGIDAVSRSLVNASWRSAKSLVKRWKREEKALGENLGVAWSEALLGASDPVFADRVGKLEGMAGVDETLRIEMEETVNRLSRELSAETFRGVALKGSYSYAAIGQDPFDVALDKVVDVSEAPDDEVAAETEAVAGEIAGAIVR